MENHPEHARDSHWRESSMGDELMTLDFDGNPFSNITIQAMADMGYEVDSSQAEAYRVPRQAAKVVAAPPTPFCRVIQPPPKW